MRKRETPYLLRRVRASSPWNDWTPRGEYAQAQQKEGPVSSYGAKHKQEDFAEAVRMYCEECDTLRDKFPQKYAVIHKMIGDK